MIPATGSRPRTARSAALLGVALVVACAVSDLTVSNPDPDSTLEQGTATAQDTSSTAGPADSVAAPPDAEPVPQDSAVTLFESSVTGVMEPRRTVIRSSEEWTAAWRELTGMLVPQDPAPELDFGVTSVVLVAMGSRPTGGYVIEVASVTAGDDTLYVTVRETSPGPECIVTQATTSPALAVLVPRVGAEVSFLEETATTDCG